MEEKDLGNILDNLVDDEFKKFKWHLKIAKVDDVEPIPVSKLSKADREEVVDLMVQKYELTGAVEVMKSVLKQISRNDLVTMISKMESGPAAGRGPAGPLGVPADKQLMSVRTQFIDRVSAPVLHNLLDHLLERGVITEGEMEEMANTANRAEKARMVIDMVRRKGAVASSALISALCELDPCLSKQLNLM